MLICHPSGLNYTGNRIITKVSVVDGVKKIDDTTFIGIPEGNITLQFSDGTECLVYIEVSNIPSVEISLKDVDLNKINSGSKDKKYKGNSIVISDEKGNTILDDNIELKGRGNTSWKFDKKSYQIKLDKKQNVLEMGKAKTWLLIANGGDASLMRNKLLYDMAIDNKMPYSINSEYVDLWVDGDYTGNYLLTEKVQVNENRVDFSDEEGLLVEMDNWHYADEKNYFSSGISGNHFVLKDSKADDEGELDSVSEKAFFDFQAYINSFETLLYADKKDWKAISSIVLTILEISLDLFVMSSIASVNSFIFTLEALIASPAAVTVVATVCDFSVFVVACV